LLHIVDIEHPAFHSIFISRNAVFPICEGEETTFPPCIGLPLVYIVAEAIVGATGQRDHRPDSCGDNYGPVLMMGKIL